MSFKSVHDKWIREHLAKRKGERKDALKRGHGYGNCLFVEKEKFRPVPSGVTARVYQYEYLGSTQSPDLI